MNLPTKLSTLSPVANWTYIPSLSYQDYLSLKANLHRARHSNEIEDLWLFTSHDPGVFTYGRSFKKSSLLSSEESIKESGREIQEIERGGDITYHGPSQLMIYPFIDVPNRDIEKLIRNLEELIITVLSEFGLTGVPHKGYPGIWCQGSKIASIGLAVRKWITMHGVSFNHQKDDGGFEMIIPCGIDGITMTSLEELQSKEINRINLVDIFVKSIENVFNIKIENIDFDNLLK